MGVTDKAVSKGERDLSFPDINSIPKLAEIFEISIDELMQVKTETKENIGKNRVEEIIDMALNGIGLAMGVAVVVLVTNVIIPNINYNDAMDLWQHRIIPIFRYADMKNPSAQKQRE